MPSEYARSVYYEQDGVSKPERVSELLARESPIVTRFQRYRTSAEQVAAAEAAGVGVEATLELEFARPNVSAMPVTTTPGQGLRGDEAARRALSYLGRQRGRGPSRSDGRE
ncbi:hypothetical protein GCM10025875_36350 [Litorihabitans aurantiacus]|nr:hypothetical protein GCM10025875_36350 [Litorihabitans aurantiacus]